MCMHSKVDKDLRSCYRVGEVGVRTPVEKEGHNITLTAWFSAVSPIYSHIHT